MKKRDRPVIEITDEMMEIGASYMTNRGVAGHWGEEVNSIAFVKGMETALMAGGYAVKIPAWIEQDS